ncbi:unnamed protein product [Amoebophrya sp. A25]|nr:unnamed protein product [Amoebophrya sp. A25]|eukprot:GSA25T00005775001.1
MVDPGDAHLKAEIVLWAITFVSAVTITAVGDRCRGLLRFVIGGACFFAICERLIPRPEFPLVSSHQSLSLQETFEYEELTSSASAAVATRANTTTHVGEQNPIPAVSDFLLLSAPTSIFDFPEEPRYDAQRVVLFGTPEDDGTNLDFARRAFYSYRLTFWLRFSIITTAAVGFAALSSLSRRACMITVGGALGLYVVAPWLAVAAGRILALDSPEGASGIRTITGNIVTRGAHRPEQSSSAQGESESFVLVLAIRNQLLKLQPSLSTTTTAAASSLFHNFEATYFLRHAALVWLPCLLVGLVFALLIPRAAFCTLIPIGVSSAGAEGLVNLLISLVQLYGKDADRNRPLWFISYRLLPNRTPTLLRPILSFSPSGSNSSTPMASDVLTVAFWQKVWSACGLATRRLFHVNQHLRLLALGASGLSHLERRSNARVVFADPDPLQDRLYIRNLAVHVENSGADSGDVGATSFPSFFHTVPGQILIAAPQGVRPLQNIVDARTRFQHLRRGQDAGQLSDVDRFLWQDSADERLAPLKLSWKADFSPSVFVYCLYGIVFLSLLLTSSALQWSRALQDEEDEEDNENSTLSLEDAARKGKRGGVCSRRRSWGRHRRGYSRRRSSNSCGNTTEDGAGSRTQNESVIEIDTGNSSPQDSTDLESLSPGERDLEFEMDLDCGRGRLPRTSVVLSKSHSKRNKNEGGTSNGARGNSKVSDLRNRSTTSSSKRKKEERRVRSTRNSPKHDKTAYRDNSSSADDKVLNPGDDNTMSKKGRHLRRDHERRNDSTNRRHKLASEASFRRDENTLRSHNQQLEDQEGSRGRRRSEFDFAELREACRRPIRH